MCEMSCVVQASVSWRVKTTSWKTGGKNSWTRTRWEVLRFKNKEFYQVNIWNMLFFFNMIWVSTLGYFQFWFFFFFASCHVMSDRTVCTAAGGASCSQILTFAGLFHNYSTFQKVLNQDIWVSRCLLSFIRFNCAEKCQQTWGRQSECEENLSL